MGFAKKGGGSKKKIIKKKGPKGKKARAKAKLDRQWGETQAITDSKNGPSFKKARQQPPKDSKPTQFSKENDHDDEKNNNVTKKSEQAVSSPENKRRKRNVFEYISDGDDEDGTKAYVSLLQNIQQKKTGKSGGDMDSDDDDKVDDTHEERAMIVDQDDDDDDLEHEPFILPADPYTARFVTESPSSKDISSSLSACTVPAVAAAASISNLVTKLDLTKYGLAAYADKTWDIQHSSAVLKGISLATAITELNQNIPPVKRWKDLAAAYWQNTRQIVKQRWEHLHSSHGNNSKFALSSTQTLLLPFLSSYADLLWTIPDGKTVSSRHHHHRRRKAVEQLVALHVLHHVLTSRNRIIRNNQRIARQQQQGKNDEIHEEEQEELVFRDQGYTRPTVLILLPTRGVCYTFVKEYLLPLFGDSPLVDKMDRFETEYGKPIIDEPIGEDGDATKQDREAIRRRRQKVLEKKGKEWLELFGDDVNDDDDFRIGLSLNPKGGKKKGDATADSNITVKLFADFFRSDIILASPLGLKMTAKDDDQELQADYLSSIEICVLARSDVLLMQNWDHVTDVLGLLNQQPKETNDTDFSRVRPYFLDGHAAQWRQLIFLAPFLDPLLLSAFKRYAKSRDGQVRIRRRVPSEEASISQVLLPTRQVFQRISCTSFATQNQDRLQYFLDKVLPALEQQKHTLIYIPSYFDYVAVRNALMKREKFDDCVSVTEYARTTEVTRGRARFLQGRRAILLYTGRAHYFHRHEIKGARHVIFWGLPEHATFYSDHVNLLGEGLDERKAVAAGADEDVIAQQAASSSCLVLFTKYEAHALERIVGTTNCNHMIKGEKSTFQFSG